MRNWWLTKFWVRILSFMPKQWIHLRKYLIHHGKCFCISYILLNSNHYFDDAVCWISRKKSGSWSESILVPDPEPCVFGPPGSVNTVFVKMFKNLAFSFLWLLNNLLISLYSITVLEQWMRECPMTSFSWTLRRLLIKYQERDCWKSWEHMVYEEKPCCGSETGSQEGHRGSS